VLTGIARAACSSLGNVQHDGSMVSCAGMCKAWFGTDRRRLSCPLAACVLQRFDENELDFQEKILYRSGLGDETYIPPCELHMGLQPAAGQRRPQHTQRPKQLGKRSSVPAEHAQTAERAVAGCAQLSRHTFSVPWRHLCLQCLVMLTICVCVRACVLFLLCRAVLQAPVL
jgi:hypothetical protein